MQSALRRAAALETAPPEPTITFDGASRTVTLTVVVSLNGSKELDIAVAPASIPQQEWTFFWDLVPYPADLQVSFANPGIRIDTATKPHLVSVVSGPSGSATQWTAKLDNRVIGVNELHYEIDVEKTAIVDGREVVTRIQKKDPSIAVTTDPPPGG